MHIAVEREKSMAKDGLLRRFCKGQSTIEFFEITFFFADFEVCKAVALTRPDQRLISIALIRVGCEHGLPLPVRLLGERSRLMATFPVDVLSLGPLLPERPGQWFSRSIAHDRVGFSFFLVSSRRYR